MNHGKIREDKTCLNCGYQVEERFCPHCGQENVETRQPFFYLFTHFIEDFTHYDGQFWKTIKYLLLRPGKLTKEYIAGKRQLYVAPVKLYIFISFITFLLPGFLPKSEIVDIKIEKSRTETIRDQKRNTKKIIDNLQKEGILSDEATKNAKNIIDTLQTKDSLTHIRLNNEDIIEKTLESKEVSFGDAQNMEQFDSFHGKDNNILYRMTRPVAEKIFELKETGLSKKQIWDKYIDSLAHTFPKALFVYLPIFAFFLWVFHNKKKWWYFDHGIFTLHYFSFLLLSILIIIVCERILSVFPPYPIINLIFKLFFTASFIYMSVYFFIAHHRVYESSKRMSILKGATLFILNSIGLTCLLLILMYISLIIMH